MKSSQAQKHRLHGTLKHWVRAAGFSMPDSEWFSIHVDFDVRSCHWLVLFVQPESEKRGVRNLGNCETDSWNITDGVTRTTETNDEHFVVLINEAHTTVAGHVGSNSLVVLFELHSDALTHGGVRLLGFDTDLLNNNA